MQLATHRSLQRSHIGRQQFLTRWLLFSLFGVTGRGLTRSCVRMFYLAEGLAQPIRADVAI